MFKIWHDVGTPNSQYERWGVCVWVCVCVRGSVRELSGAGCDDVQAADCSSFTQASFTKTAESAALTNCCEGFAHSSVTPHNLSHSAVSQQSTETLPMLLSVCLKTVKRRLDQNGDGCSKVFSWNIICQTESVVLYLVLRRSACWEWWSHVCPGCLLRSRETGTTCVAEHPSARPFPPWSSTKRERARERE